jgi:hypothetical protein
VWVKQGDIERCNSNVRISDRDEPTVQKSFLKKKTGRREKKNVHGVVDDWTGVIAKNVTTRLNSLTRRAIHIGEGCKRGIQL